MFYYIINVLSERVVSVKTIHDKFYYKSVPNTELKITKKIQITTKVKYQRIYS